MPLEPGAELGHYQIVSSLGAGGMGEVYRARDTRLGREVAIKRLLDQVASDPNRLARFEREARVLASLNHPNLATLFGFERAEETSFLVMELVEGETLAERIRRGPVPLDEAISTFLAIAEGLEAAHERGVVHRDLKPANIKLGPQGVVKILDFGLAKAMVEDGAGGSTALSHSPTLTLAATQRGEILGTAAYMSPEQARGAPVDRRTDVWAFAVCLYEALTGSLPFDGDSLADVLAAVLRSEPQWELLPAATPAGIVALLRRGLDRDPRFRLRDIGEAWVLLQRTDPVAAAPVSASGPREVTRFTTQFPAGHFLANTFQPFAVSPQGDAIVCGLRGEGTENLYLRRMDELSFRVIPGTEHGRAPFFSPDGTRLGFFQRRTIRVVPVDGGAPQDVVRCESSPIGGVWTRDGEIVWGELRSGLQLVKVDGGGRRQLTELAPEPRELWHTPHCEAGTSGWILANAVTGASGTWEVHLQLVSTRTGERRRLDLRGGNGRVAEGGRLVYQDEGEPSLSAVTLAGDPPGVTDRPVQVVRGIALDTDGVALFGLSASGTLVYSPAEARALTGKIYWITRGGAREEIPTAPNCFYSPRFSPDGETLAVVADDRAGVRQIQLLDLRRGVLEKLTSERRAALSPAWYPSGSRLAYSTLLEGSRIATREISLDELETRSPSGPERPEDEVSELMGDVSPDGRYVAFIRSHSLVDVAIVARDQAGNEEVLVEPRGRNSCPRFHPSGEYLCYVSNQSGRWEVYVRPFRRPGRRIQVSIEGGSDPVWSRDGKELFYRNGDILFTVPVELGEGLRVGVPQALFEFEFGGAVSIFTACFDVHPDGQRFVVSDLVAGDRGARHLVVCRNWTAELETSGR